MCSLCSWFGMTWVDFVLCILFILFFWVCFLILLVHILYGHCLLYSRDMCLALRLLYTCPGCCSSLLWALGCWGSSWVSAGPRHVSWLLALSGQISPGVKQSQTQPGWCQPWKPCPRDTIRGCLHEQLGLNSIQIIIISWHYVLIVIIDRFHLEFCTLLVGPFPSNGSFGYVYTM